jgi:VanZ family protein
MTRSNALQAWLPVVALVAIIWGLGSDSFSQPETSRILGPLIDWLLPWLSDAQHAQSLFYVRKLAHPAEYGLLALLCLRALCMTSGAARFGASLLGLLLVAALASADELRQSLSATRTGAGLDVALDVGGAIAVLLAVAALEKWRGGPLFGRARSSGLESGVG